MDYRRLLAVLLALFGFTTIGMAVAATGYLVGQAVSDDPTRWFLGRVTLVLGLIWITSALSLVAVTAYVQLQRELRE